MGTAIPSDYFQDPMRDAHRDILLALKRYGLAADDYPQLYGEGQPTGAAAARAYPIQGILKYHGMADWHWRTAYMPSISVNNNAADTLTLVEFDPALNEDEAIINGQPVTGRDLERIEQTLSNIRLYAGIETPARVISRNNTRTVVPAKGLGTSASASAALAAAAIGATLGPEAVANHRFLSCMARLLAGSGARSAVGGIGLWLSYAGIPHEDSYAIRLDNRNQLDSLRLLTVPLESRTGLQTEMAHREAPRSPFFGPWMHDRAGEVIEAVDAVQAGDWVTLGQLAEQDSLRLHSVTMSSRGSTVFAWEPENIHLFRMAWELRAQGIPVYFSTDTGPTTVFLTDAVFVEQVTQAINDLGMGLDIIHGALAGPVELVDVEEARASLG